MSDSTVGKNIGQVIVETPLYEVVWLNGRLKSEFLSLADKGRADKFPQDVFCIECGQESVFHRRPADLWCDEFANKRLLVFMPFVCTRQGSHMLYFLFLLDNKEDNLMKIGQYPSRAALEEPSIKKYRKTLGEEKYKEFHRAVGLVSHGVGIGSFVYLRRILEDLVEEAHDEAKEVPKWDESDYQKRKFQEKILALEDYLPEFLVRNRNMYGIMSKGIHELSEKECLGIFGALQAGIELILDAKIEEADRKKKETKAEKIYSDFVNPQKN